MLWRPIRYAPLDGTPVIVRCGEQPQDHHLVSYVGGDWMDIHGGYLLTEHETGLPTHYADLTSDSKHAECEVRSIPSYRSARTVVFLI